MNAHVGLDVEWPPFHSKGKKARAAIFQIAVPSHAFLFDLQTLLASGSDSPLHDRLDVLLKRILASPSMLKLGYGFKQDASILRRSFPSMQAFSCISPIIDLDRLAARTVRAGSVNINGLKRLVEFCGGGVVNKLQQCSDWAAGRLLISRSNMLLSMRIFLLPYAQLKEKSDAKDFDEIADEFTVAYDIPRPAIKEDVVANDPFLPEQAIRIDAARVADIAASCGVSAKSRKSCRCRCGCSLCKNVGRNNNEAKRCRIGESECGSVHCID